MQFTDTFFMILTLWRYGQDRNNVTSEGQGIFHSINRDDFCQFYSFSDIFLMCLNLWWIFKKYFMIKPEFILKSFQNCFNVTNKNYNASITGVKKNLVISEY